MDFLFFWPITSFIFFYLTTNDDFINLMNQSNIATLENITTVPQTTTQHYICPDTFPLPQLQDFSRNPNANRQKVNA